MIIKVIKGGGGGGGMTMIRKKKYSLVYSDTYLLKSIFFFKYKKPVINLGPGCYSWENCDHLLLKVIWDLKFMGVCCRG